MPSTTVVPTSDVSAGWDTIVPTTPTTHFDKIDEGTVTPNDADYIETTTVGDVDRFALGDTPSNTSEVTQIDIPVRGFLEDVSATAKVRLELFHSGTTAVTGNPKDIVGADYGGYGTTPATAPAKSWTAISLTKAQADSLELQATFLGS